MTTDDRDSTPSVAATNVGPEGVWLLLDGRELFLSFDEFPYFRGATVQQITEVQRPQPDHLYWPTLDVDLHADMFEHPERYPLRARIPSPAERTVGVNEDSTD
ncbi:MAG: DUF2442 domain-containing protein [Acidobacteriota bacterium]